MSKLLSCVIVMTLLAPHQASFGTSIAPESKSRSFGRAALVYEVRVIDIAFVKHDVKECGCIYKARVTRTVKGEKNVSNIEFGFLGGLELNKEYQIFLNPTSREFDLRGFLSSKSQDETAMENFMTQCAPLIGEYYFFRADEVRKKNGTARN
ncbi:hypothetical protein [Roseateles sp. P5_D6]